MSGLIVSAARLRQKLSWLRQLVLVGCLFASSTAVRAAWTQEHPLANGLTSIWGVSATDIYAVGSAGIILHYDGTTWSREESGTEVMLSDVRTLQDGTVVAVGGAGTILFRGQTGAWTALSTGRTENLGSIWGASPSSFIVIAGLSLYYDGSEFHEMAFELASTSEFSSIWGTSMSNVYACATGLACYHYDGNLTQNPNNPPYRYWSKAFRPEHPRPAGLDQVRWRDIWGTAADDFYLVGGDNTTGYLMHFNGSAWEGESLGTLWQKAIHGVDGTLFTVGVETFVKPAATWLAQDVPASLEDVWAASATSAFAVGLRGELLHYDGSSWQYMGGGVASNLDRVWVADSGEVFAVGEWGSIAEFDGTNWLAHKSGTREHLLGVYGSSATDVYAVGYSGTALHFDGQVWASLDLGTVQDLRFVWASGPDDVFIGGNAGFLVKKSGADWIAVDVGSSDLRRMWRSPHGELVFTTGTGLLRQDAYDGSYGTSSMRGSGRPTDLWFDGTWVTVVGSDGTVMQNQQDADGFFSANVVGNPAPVGNFNAAWGSTIDEIYATGRYGTLARFAGSDWVEQDLLGNDWNSVWGSRAGKVYAVGDHGRIVSDNLGSLPPLPPDPTVDLKVTVSEQAAPAGEVGYLVTIENVGTMEASGVVLTVTPSADTTYADGLPMPGNCTANATVYQVDCALGALPAGVSRSLGFRFVAITEAAQELVAVATSTEGDLNPADNTGRGSALPSTEPIPEGADLSLARTSGQHFETERVNSLHRVGFVCILKNNGPQSAFSIEVTGGLSAGLFSTAALDGMPGLCTVGSNDDTFSCTIDSLLPGDEVRVTAGAYSGKDSVTEIVINSTVASESYDPDPGNNTCTTQFITPPPRQPIACEGCSATGGRAQSLLLVLALLAFGLQRRRWLAR